MYQIYSPPKHLRNIIRYYWLLDLSSGTNKLTEYLFAYPYVNWVFTLGTPYCVKDKASGAICVKDTRVLGPRTNFAEYSHPEGNLTFGVTFQFGSTLPVFREETKSLINQVILQEELLPSASWLTDCFQETDIGSFIETLNGQISTRNQVSDERGYGLWEQFIDLVVDKRNYTTSASEMSRELKVSQRHLQRITLKYAGLTPKQVQSMLRCRLAVRHIQQTGMVSDFFHYGYYDQNHFIKEIKRWSGHTPKQLLTLLTS